VSSTNGLAHIVREDDGTAIGTWNDFTLKTAFQPIFAFEGGKLRVVAYEGLLRAFRNEEPMTPLEFFATVPTKERLQVETLARTLHLFNAAVCFDPAMAIFINFNPSLFTEQAVVDMVLGDIRMVLHETGVDPKRVVCELTEQKTTSQDALFTFVEALRANGLRIAVDDYGADESDITRVRELKPDIVKFDAAWVARLMDSGAGFALLTSLVDSFAARGIRTVFEGIEESWQLELAEKSGAAMVQGFVLARPQIMTGNFGGKAPLPATVKSGAENPSAAEPAGKTFGRRAPS
jgi:EAL domain-containing protein (putative c-di-GMP-specific phosphodiesterase class I)